MKLIIDNQLVGLAELREAWRSPVTIELGNEARRRIADSYDEFLQSRDDITVASKRCIDEHVFHLYVIFCEDRDERLARLNGAGIGAGLHYPRAPSRRGLLKRALHGAVDRRRRLLCVHGVLRGLPRVPGELLSADGRTDPAPARPAGRGSRGSGPTVRHGVLSRDAANEDHDLGAHDQRRDPDRSRATSGSALARYRRFRGRCRADLGCAVAGRVDRPVPHGDRLRGIRQSSPGRAGGMIEVGEEQVL